MKEPSPRASRLALTAGIAAVAIVGSGGFLLGQRSAADRPVPIAPMPQATPAPAPAPAAGASTTLDRGDLLELASQAADADARGEPMPAAVRDAVGKPFAISLPFGCDGPAEADSQAGMRWRHDEEAGALRLNVAPVAWSPTDWWPAGARDAAETIEGFWISRPWTRSEACPRSRGAVAPVGAEPVTLTGQTLAIGQAFGPDGARQGRRDGKAYTAVLKMPAGEAGGTQGFALRLTGRLAAGPNGMAVTCRQPGGADQRPVCMVLVSFDELRISDPASGNVVATWPVATTRAGATGG